MPIPVITFIGKSRAGKTTLLVSLIGELRRRGYRVATLKHHSHRGFDIDIPGKDSWRFAQAGSDQVIIAAPDKIASYRNLERELTLDELTAEISGVDIILAEGYKQAAKPTIEVSRAANSRELISEPEQRIAIVADYPLDLPVQQFHPEDVGSVADLIERKYLAR